MFVCCWCLMQKKEKKMKGELGARVNTQLQPGNKLQVKVSCESLSSLSVCESEQRLWSLCVSSGATWTSFYFPIASCASVGFSSCRLHFFLWVRLRVTPCGYRIAALLHSPGAAERDGRAGGQVASTESLRFLRRANMSRFKADLRGCNRRHERVSSTE